MSIHHTAVIDSGAELENGVSVGPFSIIGAKVKVGRNTEIGSHVRIEPGVVVGKNCRVFHNASLGGEPQIVGFDPKTPSSTKIGDGTTIREYVTVHRSGFENGVTQIGKHCLLMAYTHVAHDCKVGNNVIIANNVPLGGHVTIEDNVVIGGNSAVQQFTRIGQMAMIGGMTGVLHDVIPYGLSVGNRNYLQGLNLIGLRRANFENKDILGLSEAYKEIFATKNLSENLNKLNGAFKENPLVKNVIEFINKDKKRSICTPFSKE